MTQNSYARQDREEQDRTFTRITVATPVRQVDLAVPDDMTGADLMRVLLADLGLTSAGQFVLEHPVYGFWPAEETPRHIGLLDGEILNLRTLEEREIARPVDDVADGVAVATDSAAGWSTSATHLTFSVVLGAWCAGAAVWSGSIRPVEARPFVLAACLVVLLVAQILAVRLGRLRECAAPALFFLATSGFSAWVVTGQMDLQVVDRVALTAAALGAAVTLVGLIDPARAWVARPVGLGLLAAAPAVLLARVAPALWGWGAVEVSAAVSVLTALGLGLVTKLGVSTSGLLRVDTDSAEGYAIYHRDLGGRVDQSAVDITALLTGLSVPAAAAMVVLLGGDTWALLTGLVLALVIAGRARGYRRRRHVGVLLVAPVLALCAAALAAALEAPSSPLAPVVLLGAIPLLGLTLYTPRDIQDARFKVRMDRLEIAALVALVPLVFAVFDLYVLVYDRFA